MVSKQRQLTTPQPQPSTWPDAAPLAPVAPAVPVAADPFRPQTLTEAMRLAEMLAAAGDVIPRDFRGKPGAIFLALQFCVRVGLDPLMCLQNMAVINGKLCIYGDLLWGIVLSQSGRQPLEECTGSIAGKDLVWKVTLWRPGCTADEDGITAEFSYKRAHQCGYLTKKGPWSQDPERMVLWRARHFAARNAMADLLQGVAFREEVEDYQIKDARTGRRTTRPPNAMPAREPEAVEPTAAAAGEEPPNLNDILMAIVTASSVVELTQEVAPMVKAANLSDADRERVKKEFIDRRQVLYTAQANPDSLGAKGMLARQRAAQAAVDDEGGVDGVWADGDDGVGEGDCLEPGAHG